MRVLLMIATIMILVIELEAGCPPCDQQRQCCAKKTKAGGEPMSSSFFTPVDPDWGCARKASEGSACDWKQYGYEIPCGCEAHLICKSQICVDPTKQATKSTQPTRQQPTLAPTERTTQQTSGGSGRCKSVCGADQCCQETVKTVQITTPGIKFQWTPQNPDRSPYLCAPKNVAGQRFDEAPALFVRSCGCRDGLSIVGGVCTAPTTPTTPTTTTTPMPTTTPMCQGQVSLGDFCRDIIREVQTLTVPTIETLVGTYCYDSGLVSDDILDGAFGRR